MKTENDHLDVERKQSYNDAFVALSVNMLCVCGFDGVMKWVNSIWTMKTGYSEEEILSQPFMNFVYQEDKEKTTEAMSVLNQGKSVFDFRNRYLTKDGKIIWLEWNTSSVVSDQLIFGVARDVTKEVETLLELNERRNNSEIIAEVTNEVIIEFDHQSGLVTWRGEIENNWDLQKQERIISIDDWFSLIHSDERNSVISNISNAIESDQDFIFDEFRLVKNSDEVVTVKFKARILRNNQNGHIKIIGGLSNISAIRKVEELKNETDRLFNLSENLMSISTIGGKPLYLNPSWQKKLGFGIDEIFSTGTRNYIIPEDKVKTQEFISKLLNGESISSFNNRLLCKDGSIKTFSWKVSSDLKRNVFYSVGQDITDEVHYYEKLAESEKKYKLISQVTSDVVWDLDLVTNELWWNDGLLKVFGYNNSKSIQNMQFWYDNVHPDDHDRVGKKVDDAISGTDTEWDDVYRFRNSEGNYLHVHDRAHIIRDLDGKAVRMLGGISDLSEKIKSDELLKKSEERYRILFENNPIPLFIFDLKTLKFLSVNKRTVETYGYSEEEFKNMTLYDIRPESDYSILNKFISEINDNQTPQMLNTRGIKHRKKDGSIIDVQITRNIAILDNVPVGIILSQDVTEIQKMEHQVKMMNEDLEKRVLERTQQLDEINKELEAFSYSVSHDLRTPLRIINGFSQSLTDEFGNILSENGKYYLERIDSNTQKMGKLIDDMLMLSRVSRFELAIRRFNVCEIVKEIAKDMSSNYQDKAYQLECDHNLIMNADPNTIRILITNLISNAFKFSISRPVTIIKFGETVVKNGQTYFFLSDNGVGFEMKYSDKLFKAFQRLHNDSDFPGTGIGLAIVKRIINKHAGEIWVESELGKGTTYYFRV